RKEGTVNKRTAAALAIIDAVVKENRTPLEYLLDGMNDPNRDPEYRKSCAIAAAPFVHPRLNANASVTKHVDGADAEFGRLFAAIEQRLALAPPAARAEIVEMLRAEEDEIL